MAKGDEKERIYFVDATGEVKNDPNVTDKKIPGNPTMSYRSEQAFKGVEEVTLFHKHSPDEIETYKAGLRKLTEQGINTIID